MAGRIGFMQRAAAALTGWLPRPIAVGGGAYIDQSFPVDWFQRGMERSWFGGSLPIVEACLAAYSQTIAQCPGYHKRRLPNGGTETIENSPLAKILRRPNDYQTRSDFLVNLVRQLLGTGNGLALGERAGGVLTALHLVATRRVTVVRSPEDYSDYYYGLEGYGFDNYGPLDPTKFIPPRNMLNVRMNSPDDPLRGQSPLVHAANAGLLNAQIGTSLTRFYKNMARPSGILATEEKLTADQVRRLRGLVNEQATDFNTGGILIMTNGLKWSAAGMTAQDAEIIAAFNLSEKQIANVFRIPLAMVGQMEQATFNNSETLMAFWLKSGLGFLIDNIELAFDQFFNLPPDEFTEFDTDALLRTDTPQRMEAWAKAVLGGIMSPNEARAREDLPAMPFGDEPRVQQQVVPLSAYDDQRKAQEAKAEADAEAAKIAAAAPPAPEPPPQLPEPPPPASEADKAAVAAMWRGYHAAAWQEAA